MEPKQKDGVTPLHWAALKGYKEIAEVLLANSAPMEAKDEDGATPLHWAALNGHKAVADFLLAKGADKGKLRDNYRNL